LEEYYHFGSVILNMVLMPFFIDFIMIFGLYINLYK
jgi:hypothetical protein